MWFYILKMLANVSWNSKSWHTKARRRKISSYWGMPQQNVVTHANKSWKAILNGGVLSARQCLLLLIWWISCEERGRGKKCILKADSELIMLFTVELSKSVWNEKPGRDAGRKEMKSWVLRGAGGSLWSSCTRNGLPIRVEVKYSVVNRNGQTDNLTRTDNIGEDLFGLFPCPCNLQIMGWVKMRRGDVGPAIFLIGSQIFHLWALRQLAARAGRFTRVNDSNLCTESGITSVH